MQKFKTVDELVSQLKPERPVYCIRKKSIQVASRTFQNKFSGTILYAVKTNPHPEVLKTIIHSGINNFDVASIKEIQDIRKIKPEMDLIKNVNFVFHFAGLGDIVPSIQNPKEYFEKLITHNNFKNYKDYYN